MQDLKNLESRVDNLEVKVDKIAETVILLCKIVDPNLPEITRTNLFLSLKSLSTHLEGLLRPT